MKDEFNDLRHGDRVIIRPKADNEPDLRPLHVGETGHVVGLLYVLGHPIVEVTFNGLDTPVYLKPELLEQIKE